MYCKYAVKNKPQIVIGIKPNIIPDKSVSTIGYVIILVNRHIDL